MEQEMIGPAKLMQVSHAKAIQKQLTKPLVNGLCFYYGEPVYYMFQCAT